MRCSLIPLNSQAKPRQDSWFQHEGENTSTSSSIGEDSSSSSSETEDDASSSRALFDLSDIMSQLPIKRGLSKFYQGKSESFTSLSRASSIEDLAKKPDAAAAPYRRHLKSFAIGLNRYKPYILPKAIISKKTRIGGKPPMFPPCKNSQC